MKKQELKRKIYVFDRWFLYWGTGQILRILKTRVHIKFPDMTRIYDNAHLQFLERAK